MKHHYSKQMQNFGEQHPAFRYWHSFMRRRVRVEDNGGTTVDRYTVAINRMEKGRRVWDIYTMSADPNSPQGVNMFSHTIRFLTMGKTTPVQDLPEAVIEAIEARAE